MFRPSNTTWPRIADLTRCQDGRWNCFHSVRRSSASAPSTASYMFPAYSIEFPSAFLACSVPSGSKARTSAPSSINLFAMTSEGASRTSSVRGLKLRPHSAIRSPCKSFAGDSPPKWARTFDTIEELRAALLVEFARHYNETWLVARHGHRTPAQVRADQSQLDQNAMADLKLAA